MRPNRTNGRKTIERVNIRNTIAAINQMQAEAWQRFEKQFLGDTP